MNPTTHTPEKLREEFEGWCAEEVRDEAETIRRTWERRKHRAPEWQTAVEMLEEYANFIERSAADACVAWIVSRERDRTFPRAYIRECDADEMCNYVTLHPLAVKQPLYTRPAQAREVVCELSDVLDKYEHRVRALPVGHEIVEKGCSTYNWRMSVIRDLRAMIAAAPTTAKESA